MPQSMHSDAPVAAMYLPGVQSLHEVAPVVAIAFPDAQSEQLADPSVLAAVPAAQLEHCDALRWSAAEVPASDKNVPVEQAVQLAAPSRPLVCLPALHTVHELAPSSEYFPTSHLVQLDPPKKESS